MSVRSEPFVWIHLVGIAIFPILVIVTLLGLTVGDSYSHLIELPLLAAIAILPILLMQLRRPFDIFSVLFLSLAPESLSESQRKILSLFKTAAHKVWSIAAASMMLVLLWLIYQLSPLVLGIASFIPQWRVLGLGIAAIAFLGSNLFLQIPLSVLQVLVTPESKFTQIEPYPIEALGSSFTIPGVKVNKILWFGSPPPQVEETN